MRWSWRIGRFAGIDVRVHATFLLLLAWIALGARRGGESPAAIAGLLTLVLAVFAIIVLHEAAHAVVARHYGIRTRDITLLPIGGVARLERMPREPRQELLIALAGPTLNFVLAAVLIGALAALGGLRTLGTTSAPSLSVVGVLSMLASVNLSLGLFNLFPAFPLDGGRVLRAALAMGRRDYVAATQTAARIGRWFAIVFGVAGLFILESPSLVLISLFVWLSAASEANAVETSWVLAQASLDDLLVTDVKTLSVADPLSRAVTFTMHGFQQDFPVVDGEVLVGMLGRTELVHGLAEHGSASLVGDAMRRDVTPLAASENAEQALKAMTTQRVRALPVVRANRLAGLLTADNVLEYVMFHHAVAQGAPH